jgi:hypothetical protein
MKWVKGTAFLLMGFLFTLSAAGAQAVSKSEAKRYLDQLVDRITANENHLVRSFAVYTPRVETYIQEFQRGPNDKTLGPQIVGDAYFLGRLITRKRLVEQTLLPQPSLASRILADATLYKAVKRLTTIQFQTNVFGLPIFVDPRHFDRRHYKFTFVRRDFLGEVRCLVFDVTPRKHAGKDLFKGRIWVEDRGYNIVRFNGSYGPHARFGLHFDSWRENLQPGIWLPVYIYSEETNLGRFGAPGRGFRAQTRFWGYDLKSANPEEQLTRLMIESKSAVDESQQAARDYSPLASQRMWLDEAAENVLDRLQKAGLVAPPGPVDKVLDTVVNNLIITNHLNTLPPIHCRVLLTYPLETLTVGDTILISRGLLDVLPNEACLAMMLAHELGHILNGDNISTQYAFDDRMMVPDDKLLQTLDLTHSAADEAAADQRALALLMNSPYKNQLASAGLFLKALAETAPHTPALLGAHLGNRLLDRNHQLRLAALMMRAPSLQPANLHQIAALPLGSRIEVNAWNDQVSLVKAKALPLVSPKDKMPFEVTALFPYLTRYHAPSRAEAPVQAQAQPRPSAQSQR